MEIDLSVCERDLISKALVAYLVDCYSEYSVVKEHNPSLAFRFYSSKIVSLECLLKRFK